MKNILDRFEAMHSDAFERCIKITDDQVCQLVLADAIENHGLRVSEQLSEISHSIKYTN